MSKSHKGQGDKMGKEITIRITDTASCGNGGIDSSGHKSKRSGGRCFKPTETWHHGEHSAHVGVLRKKSDIVISESKKFPFGRSVVLSRADFNAMNLEQTAERVLGGDLTMADIEAEVERQKKLK